MNKRLLLWGVLVAVVVLTIIVIMQMASDDTTEAPQPPDQASVSEEQRQILEINSDDWVKGNPDADVVIVKYSDFQCPACRTSAQMDAQVEDELSDEVAFVYRHFPLQSFDYSRLAAQYAEAAGKQDEFWRMHNLIFINQQQWSRGDAESVFRDMAESMELDMDQFEQDLESSEVEERIDEHYNSGRQLGVQSVPTLYINGSQVQLPQSPEEYVELIRRYM